MNRQNDETQIGAPAVVAFGHERLDCYRVALDLARWAAGVGVPAHRRHLRDQLVRAADSVVLSIAEGCGHHRDSNARRNHYRIALGSVAEVHAVIDLLDPVGGVARADQARRVGAMLAGCCGGLGDEARPPPADLAYLLTGW